MITEEDEQELCVSCGFCCDKTLFDYAKIEMGEKAFGFFKDNLDKPEGNRYFKLPCVFFDGKCTIYDQKKPRVCSKFKCKLLRKTISGDVSKDEALNVVQNAIRLRNEIVTEYERIFNQTLPFRDILHETSKNQKFDQDAEKKSIKFKVNLLDIQLSQEFKSKQEFDTFYEMLE